MEEWLLLLLCLKNAPLMARIVQVHLFSLATVSPLQIWHNNWSSIQLWWITLLLPNNHHLLFIHQTCIIYVGTWRCSSWRAPIISIQERSSTWSQENIWRIKWTLDEEREVKMILCDQYLSHHLNLWPLTACLVVALWEYHLGGAQVKPARQANQVNRLMELLNWSTTSSLFHSHWSLDQGIKSVGGHHTRRRDEKSSVIYIQNKHMISELVS